MAGSGRGPILIVDDNVETREVLQSVLELRGYRCVTAGSGGAALSYLRDGNPACLIILDMQLPDIGGPEVHRALQSDPALASIPVVIFSGNDPEKPLENIVAYIRKGRDPETLLDVIARTCPKE